MQIRYLDLNWIDVNCASSYPFVCAKPFCSRELTIGNYVQSEIRLSQGETVTFTIDHPSEKYTPYDDTTCTLLYSTPDGSS